MVKKSFVLLCIISCVTVGSALAGDPLTVSLQCPQSVVAGQALDVAATVYNGTDSQVTVARAVTTFGGNANNSLSGMGLFGPFSRSLAATINSGSQINPTIRIIDSVPYALKGKVAVAAVILSSSNFSVSLGRASCFLEVK